VLTQTASCVEALGMSLPYSSSTPATDALKLEECRQAGEAIKVLLERDIKPSDIMTKKAFQNVMVVLMALDGSIALRNLSLILGISTIQIAMARTMGVPLEIDEFQAFSDKIPFFADLKPRYLKLMQRKVRDGRLAQSWRYTCWAQGPA
jgi:dihydroxy-acid dehydratase